MCVCLNTHKHCREHNQSSNLPARLIFVSYDEDDCTLTARLHILSQVTENLEYLTLSHCWGGAKILTLNAGTIEPFQNDIPLIDLPKTFRDALLITHKLGFSYIWIDSLCIMQDSAADWATESAKMGGVYAGSMCTIAATGSSDGRGGCFKDRDLRGLTDCVLVRGEGGSGLRLCMCKVLETSFENQVDASPLNTRAWVFQERLLSPRIVHFASKMIFWECQECVISEQHPHSPIMHKSEREEERLHNRKYTNHPRIEDQGLMRTRMFSPRKQRDTESNANDRMDDFRGAFDSLTQTSIQAPGDSRNHLLTSYWYELVTRYSLGRLTKAEDRLVAISGIAELIQARTGMTYILGLWQEHLIYNLLWYTDAPAYQRPSGSYRAPSWSWASLDGMVMYEKVDSVMSTYRCTPCASVVSVDIRHKAHTRFSSDTKSLDHIQLKGVLRRIDKDASVQHDPRTGTSYPFSNMKIHPDVSQELFSRAIFVFKLLQLECSSISRNYVLKQTRGLVLAPCRQYVGQNVFRRIGYYSTKFSATSPEEFDGSLARQAEIVTII